MLSQIREAEPGAEPGRSVDDALGLALQDLAYVLSQAFPLVRVSLRTVDFATGTVHVAGVWAKRPSKLPPGLRMTMAAGGVAEVLAEGRAVIRRPGKGPNDDLLLDEGIRSTVVVPLRDGDVIRGLLSISSADPEIFDSGLLPFFDEVGRYMAASLLHLADDQPAVAGGT